jgi:DNA polymerase
MHLTDQLSRLDQEIKNCSSCDLRVCTGDYGPTLPAGYADAKIMVVGRNPGADELTEGIPFIGRAGRRLDQLIEVIGLTRRHLWITNTCKCYSEKNRTPKPTEIKSCASFLRREIDLLKPSFIMVFGNEAMSLFLPYTSGITKYNGQLFTDPQGGILGKVEATVACCVHPSMALRGDMGEAHFRKFEEIMKGLFK